MEALKEQLEELRKLREFKAYVHKRLDVMGVPTDPDPEKNAETGCRIEGRINWLRDLVFTQMPTILNMVEEFHEMFQHPVLESPQIPNDQRVRLRIALIEEEAREFAEAASNGDLIGVADALCDLQYVLAGAVLEFGLKYPFPRMFAEVQRSNMSKACSSKEEAEMTMQDYIRKDQDLVCDIHAEEKNGKFLVYRTHDRKTLKSINYSPANLQQFL